VILPDNDGPGREHAEKVAKLSKPLAATVKVVELPGLPDHGDVSDWLDAGHTLDKLAALADAAPPWQLQKGEAYKGDGGGFSSNGYENGKYPEGDDPSHFSLSDTGNAELFAYLNRDQLRYDHRRGQWLSWASHWWTADVDGAAVRLCKELIREMYRRSARLTTAASTTDDPVERVKLVTMGESLADWGRKCEARSRRDSILALAQWEYPLTDPGGQWDQDGDMLGVGNGVYDLRAFKLRPGHPDDRMRSHTATRYNPDAQAPRWGRFIREIFGNDDVLIDYIWRAAGYSLTGDCSEQIWFLLHGGGSNGKGSFLNTLLHVLGDYGYNAPISTFLAKDRPQDLSNDVAALMGRRFVVSSEAGPTRRLNEERIKSLTGQDRQTARFLYQEPFEFEPTFKLWLGVNHLPRTDDHSKGFWRRVRVVPFLQEFPINNTLQKILLAESEGILAWLIEGCRAWRERGLQPPDVVIAATDEYRAKTDQLTDYFDQCCRVGTDYAAGATELYKSYRRWCFSQAFKEKEIFSSTRFGRQLRDRFKKEHSRSGAIYRGVGILGALVTGLDAGSGTSDGFEGTSQDFPGNAPSYGVFMGNLSNPSHEATNPSPQAQDNPSQPVTNPSPDPWDTIDDDIGI